MVDKHLSIRYHHHTTYHIPKHKQAMDILCNSFAINKTSSIPPSNFSRLNKIFNFTTSHIPKSKSHCKVSFSLTQQQLFNHSFRIASSNPSNISFRRTPSSNLKFSAAKSADVLSSSTACSSSECSHWVVLLDKLPEGVQSKEDIMDYYISILQRALSSDTDAKSCIYSASCDFQLRFCCNVDEGTSRVLARVPGVISVKPDSDIHSGDKDSSTINYEESSVPNSSNGSTLLFPGGFKHWLVCVDNPPTAFSLKAHAVDFYVSMLTNVLGNEKDAQMCLYHVSWQSNFGFCCTLDEESVKALSALPGVLSIRADENFESDNKDYGGGRLLSDSPNSAATTEFSKTKVFVTGLSFYTSEKTLRAAFEPFGELVEVKVIMDKISKRSKGYAFIEYTAEEAATTALREMNGKIINGWMIVVDRAKSKPRYGRGRSMPTFTR